MIRVLTAIENSHWVGVTDTRGIIVQILDASPYKCGSVFGQRGAPNDRCREHLGKSLWDLVPAEFRDDCRRKVIESLSGQAAGRCFYSRKKLRVRFEFHRTPSGTFDFSYRQVKSPFSSETERVIRCLMTSGLEVKHDSLSDAKTLSVKSDISTSQHIKNVAEQLGVAATTVRRHLQNAKRQSGCSNMSNFQFGAFCILHGLVDHIDDQDELVDSRSNPEAKSDDDSSHESPLDAASLDASTFSNRLNPHLNNSSNNRIDH